MTTAANHSKSFGIRIRPFDKSQKLKEKFTAIKHKSPERGVFKQGKFMVVNTSKRSLLKSKDVLYDNAGSHFKLPKIPASKNSTLLQTMSPTAQKFPQSLQINKSSKTSAKYDFG